MKIVIFFACTVCCLVVTAATPSVAGVTLALGDGAITRLGGTLSFVVTANGSDSSEPLDLVLVSEVAPCASNSEFTLLSHQTLSCKVDEWREPGKYNAVIVGLRKDGTEVLSNSVSFIVEPIVPVKSITVRPKRLAFAFAGPGQQEKLDIFAKQTDGKLFSLKGIATLRFQNPEIATLDDAGYVIARKPGSTTLEITYEQEGATVFKATVPVSVGNASSGVRSSLHSP